MSRKKERLEQKQKKREDKLLAQIKRGKAIRVFHEERKQKENLPNRKCAQKTPDEEMTERQEKVEKATIVYRQLLPRLLAKLSRIKDPRQPSKIKHKLTVLMVYGILLFVYHTGSRREANRRMSKPIF
jgi:hypothetical protein